MAKEQKNEMPTLPTDPKVEPGADTSVKVDEVSQATPTVPKVSTVARAVKSSMSVEPSADAELLDSKVVGGVQMANPTQLGNAAGLTSASMISDASRKPYSEGGVRPQSRFGKKIQFSDFVINNTISEQIDPKFNDVPELRDDPEAEVGGRGRPQYKEARARKNAGAMPQNALYERSVDYYHHGTMLHATGQVLKTIQSQPQCDYPTREYSVDGAHDSYGIAKTPNGNGYVDISTPMKKSNYLINALVLKFKNGQLSGISFDEMKIEAAGTQSAIGEANMNWQVDANHCINAMQRLQRELGRETQDKWSPIPFAMEQGYQYLNLWHDVEATAGAIATLGTRSALKSWAHQLNIISKDGTRPMVPYAREFLDGLVQRDNDQYYSHVIGTNIAQYITARATHNTDTAKMLEGNAFAFIGMDDTVAKYDSKAAIMNLPKSLKRYFTTAANNFGILTCKEEFIKALNAEDTYSTESGNYNPLLPIHILDRVRLMLPLSLNRFLLGWQHPGAFDGIHTGTSNAIYAYRYKDERSTYTWAVKHPIVEGILAWLLKHEHQLANEYGGDGSTERTVRLPVNFDMTTFSAFSILLCAASNEISNMRNYWMRDVVYASDQTTYLFPDLKKLSDLSYDKPTQYSLGEIGEPIKLGRLNDNTRLRYEWPETYREHYTTKSSNRYVNLMPWYLSESAYLNKQAFDPVMGWKNESAANLVNYPQTRCGVSHVVLEDAIKHTPKQLLLAFDQMVDIPYVGAVSQNAEAATGDVVFNFTAAAQSTYVSTDSGTTELVGARYDSLSDGRLGVVRSSSNRMSAIEVIATPRRFGYIFPDFGDNIARSIDNWDVTQNPPAMVSTAVARARLDVCRPADRYDYLEAYKSAGEYDIRGASSQILDRSAALQQTYHRFFANRRMEAASSKFARNIGFAPALSMVLSNSNLNHGGNVTITQTFAAVDFLWSLNGNNPASGFADNTDESRFVTLSRLIWPIIQRLRFAVNPFEGCEDDSTHTTPIDDMEVAGYFGFVGFKCVDYEELVERRTVTVDQLQLDYLKDVFLSESEIFA